mmetsp:Transcript_256/g.692  ORF Transcript_256/g.692 Transcript_256/m.692 type:complete len:211 (-) Transcript_256:374-1006(-)
MSRMLPVFEVVQFVIVNPMVNVSIINLGTIPTKHIVPRGRKRPKKFSNSTVSEVAMVTKMKSNVPAAFSISSSEVCTKNPVAPCSRAMSFFESEELIAITSFPNAFANLIAMCPRPPRPNIPILSPGFVCSFNGVHTVCPPHNIGAISQLSNSFGMGNTNCESSHRITSANPPLLPSQHVHFTLPHSCSLLLVHHSHEWHEADCQPTPTL